MNGRLQGLFASLFKVTPGQWADTLSPQDVAGWDSLGHLSLVQAIEAEFQISLADGDLTEMEDVGKIKAVLARAGVAP
jgi:acyl carrier protein